MAEVKHALVRSSTPLAGGLHHLACEAVSPLGARAGQWLAIATELPHPEKADVLRRAWSIAAIRGERGFELLIAVVGPCTRWLAEEEAGATLRFTGPWGTKFQLDEETGPVGLFATGSGLSPIGALADAALDRGRPVALWWDTSEIPDVLKTRLEGWRSRGARVEAGDGARPRGGEAAWWLAGDGARLEAVAAALAGTVRVERFYPLEKK